MMTSCEPARTAAYSPDIGWRVVWQRVGMELKFKEIAARLHIGVGTAHRLYSRYVETGDVSPKKASKRPCCRKVDDLHQLYIIGLIHENPAIYLHEICSKISDVTGVSVSCATICQIIHKNGVSRKKLTKIALQRSIDHRGAFLANILHYPRDFFVWVDETGSDRRDQLRKFGYSVRGLPATCKRLLTRGTRVSAIVGMSSDGVEAYELSIGSTDSIKFIDFIRGNLIPTMQPFPDKHSIIIMDNCSIHHVQEVKDIVDSCGIVLFYLPPYSPDLNPIEELFSYLKYYLKNHEDLLSTSTSLSSPHHSGRIRECY